MDNATRNAMVAWMEDIGRQEQVKAAVRKAEQVAQRQREAEQRQRNANDVRACLELLR